MRLRWTVIVVSFASVVLFACTPDLTGTGGPSLIDAVSVVGDTGTAGSGTSPGGSQTLPTAQTQNAPTTLSGSVAASGDYRLFDAGAGTTGDEWIVKPAAGSDTSFLVVLFDADHELLRRELVSPRTTLEHVVRTATPTIYVGVAPANGSGGGDFSFVVTQRAGVAIPAPAQQVVWLNFAGGSDVRVQARSGISFPALAAAVVNPQYAGQSAMLKSAIVAAMREDYAAYNVVILSSDEGPVPGGPHATIQFGGDDPRLLGLADNVDQYNADPGQTAMVYVEAFADYKTMELSADEMGQMIGNTASHELGHLLGLFHTQKPVDIMDTTGSAWDLATDQSFTTGSLEPSVFPTGSENSPARLAETVGEKAGPKEKGVTKPLSPEMMLRKASLRALMRNELRSRCGTCLDPDG